MKHILIISYGALLENLTDLLILEGFTVHDFSDGPTAVEFARTHPPDLAVVCTIIPNAFTTFSELIHLPETQSTIFFAVVTHPPESSFVQGAHRTFVQPLPIDDFLSCIHDALH